MPFLNLEWTSNRIQFFGEVDLFSVLSGLLYRNEWSSISGILSNLNKEMVDSNIHPYLQIHQSSFLLIPLNVYKAFDDV